MSIYPNAIDGFEQLPMVIDGITKVNANSVNTLREAILNIEKELGIRPSAFYSTVRERLDALERSVGDMVDQRLSEVEVDLADLEGQINTINTDLGPNFKGSYLNLSERLNNIENLLISPLSLNAEEEIFEGSLVRITVNGGVKEATAGISGGEFIRRAMVIGASKENYNIGESAVINATFGSLINIRFATAPDVTDNGYPVYLSLGDAGCATLNRPDNSGSAVFQIGILQGADGISLVPKVLFQPMLIAINS